MDRSLFFPLPKFRDQSKGINRERENLKDLSYWSSKLRRLAANPALWMETAGLLKKMEAPCEHTMARIAVGREEQSLLHLAVLNDCQDCVALLSQDKELLKRRNQFECTPLELALYLHKVKIAEILSGRNPIRSFSSQPNVEFEEEILDLHYISHPIYESREALDEILTRTAKAKMEDTISQERIWMGVHYDKEIEEEIHPRLAVRKVDEKIGLGVFASERILPCTFLGEYTGVIRKRSRREEGESVFSFSYTAWKMGKHPYVINAERMGNFTRFINHSDEPSAEAICVYWRGMPRIIFISRREIPEGGQIHFDYGKLFWKQVPHLRKCPL